MEKDGKKMMVCGPGASGAVLPPGLTPVEAELSDWNLMLVALSECDGVFMTKGWKKDKMAKLIHFIALKVGLTVMVEK